MECLLRDQVPKSNLPRYQGSNDRVLRQLQFLYNLTKTAPTIEPTPHQGDW
jgi:hypothetical protein